MTRSTINFGVLLPTREAVMSGRSDPSTLMQLAERAEALGFSSVWVGDSLFSKPRWEPISLLSAISLGLGYAWHFLDEDGLCWHERVTKTHIASHPKKL